MNTYITGCGSTVLLATAAAGTEVACWSPCSDALEQARRGLLVLVMTGGPLEEEDGSGRPMSSDDEDEPLMEMLAASGSWYRARSLAISSTGSSARPACSCILSGGAPVCSCILSGGAPVPSLSCFFSVRTFFSLARNPCFF